MSDPHPLIVGLAGAVPEKGQPFPRERRELWLKTAALILDLIFGEDSEPVLPAPPSNRTVTTVFEQTTRMAQKVEGTGREPSAAPAGAFAESVLLPPPEARARELTHQPQERSVAPKDSSGLKALSPNEAKVFASLKYFLRLNRRPSIRDLADRSMVAVGSMGACLDGLERKGYIKNYGQLRAPDWHIIFDGEPAMMPPQTYVGKNGGPKPRPPVEPAAPVQAAGADDPLGMADLSARQRSVLVLVHKGDLSNHTLALAQIDLKELGVLLHSLRGLEVIELLGEKWILTDAGRRILVQIQSKPGPGPVDATISMPRMTFRPSKPPGAGPVPLKNDPAVRAAIDAHLAKPNGVQVLAPHDERFAISERLTKWGFKVTDGTAGNSWTINGNRLDWANTIRFVNQERQKRDMPPLPEAMFRT